MIKLKKLMVCLVLLTLIAPCVERTHAVPAAVKAKSEFMLADKMFNEGNFSGAIKHAENAKSILGKSNSRIEYMLTKAYSAQEQYGKALAALEAFFKVTPESRSGSTEYNEMVSLYAEVEVLSKVVSSPLHALSQQMVAVSSGCFNMGNSDTSIKYTDDERPVHRVCVDGFSIGKYEVTQALWVAVMGSNPSNFQGLANPVEKVNWDDVQQFLRKLNIKTGKHYRLPTEAEWEFAARSGKNEKYSGGSNLDRVAWYKDNSGETTHPVGGKAANGLGLYDMSGNVWEWCQDWYGEKYYGSSPKNNPTGPSSGRNRVARGGAWTGPTEYVRVACRFERRPHLRHSNLGFRLVLP